MSHIGSHPSQADASPEHRSFIHLPMAILFAGLAFNLAWIVGLVWLAVKLAFALLVG